MIHWLKNLLAPPEPIPSTLWLATLSTHSFLTALSAPERSQLKKLSEAFLASKQDVNNTVKRSEIAIQTSDALSQKLQARVQKTYPASRSGACADGAGFARSSFSGCRNIVLSFVTTGVLNAVAQACKCASK